VVAFACSWWTLGLGAAVTALRALVWRERWFLLSGAALLHVTLHGLVGLSYLVAGTIAGVLAAVAVAVAEVRARRSTAAAGGGQ